MAQYTTHRPWASGPWGASFDQLRQEMDALFHRYRGAAPATGGQGVFPAVNFYETAEAYMLMAELPGVDPGDIHVSLEGSTVTVEGQRKIDYGTREDVSLHRRERQAGSFRRAFELPAAIDADGVEAVHRNGVLKLRLPRSAEGQPRQIPVQASRGGN